jgi:hypothetical protein
MKKMSARKKQKMLQERRESVVPTMAMSQEIANTVFGGKSNDFAVHEIFDYTIGANDEGLAAFKADLKEAIEGAKVKHRTESPTPEQVFEIFEPSRARAREIAVAMFGAKSNDFAIREIFDYTSGVNGRGITDFKADLKEAIEGAQVAHSTHTPTPEQVFKIFEELNYEGDDEDKGEE